MKGKDIFINFIIWIIIILASLLTFINLTTKKNGVAYFFGYVPINVTHNSMSPTINNGDYIITKKYTDQTIKKGDIISFVSTFNGKSIILTHRVISILDDGSYKTKGDSNISEDEFIVNDIDIISIYTGICLPRFGKLVSFLQSKSGFFIVIVIPLCGYIIYQLYNIFMLISEKEGEVQKKN